MAKNKAPHIPAKLMELYDRAIGTLNGVARKGAANPYTSQNGYMFSFLDKEARLSLRVDKKYREEFIEKYPDAVSVQYNTVMKDFIRIPHEIMEDEERLHALFKMSFEHTSSLKPK